MALTSTFYMLYKNKKITKAICGCLQNAQYCTSLQIKHNFKTDALESLSEDLSNVTPYLANTFNLAAYVNNSETLKNLVHLNVDLSKIEKKPFIVEKVLKLDFEKNMKNHILFLSDFVGMDEIGYFLTKNPMILCEPLEDLQVRINYLESKSFKDEQIKAVVTKNPFWLMFSTLRIDRRFGFYQTCFNLSGNEVRELTTKQPKLITYNLHHVKCNHFALKEEMGFEDNEIKEILLKSPKLFMLNQRSLLERFNYIHKDMQISHKNILENSEILFCRNFKIKQRHLFLRRLGRAQYNPKKENYIPLNSLVKGTDAEFSMKIAKCNVNDFNMFLKTL